MVAPRPERLALKDPHFPVKVAARYRPAQAQWHRTGSHSVTRLSRAPSSGGRHWRASAPRPREYRRRRHLNAKIYDKNQSAVVSRRTAVTSCKPDFEHVCLRVQLVRSVALLRVSTREVGDVTSVLRIIACRRVIRCFPVPEVGPELRAVLGEKICQRRMEGCLSLTSSRERACRKRLMMVLLDVNGRWRDQTRPTLDTVSLIGDDESEMRCEDP